MKFVEFKHLKKPTTVNGERFGGLNFCGVNPI